MYTLYAVSTVVRFKSPGTLPSPAGQTKPTLSPPTKLFKSVLNGVFYGPPFSAGGCNGRRRFYPRENADLSSGLSYQIFSPSILTSEIHKETQCIIHFVLSYVLSVLSHSILTSDKLMQLG